jgi:2-oxoglutarate ferredoxin oxidoreductase subunit beta
VAAGACIQEHMKQGEYLTGLLHVEASQGEFHELNGTPDKPLNSVPYEKHSPGSKGLDKILSRFR